MKLNRLETHDRLLHLKKDQSANISQGAEDCLKKNPLSLALQAHSHYVYLFAHPRTADDGVTKRLLWQPRLTRPAAQTNSYLFRALSKTDTLEVCWHIPPKEMWSQYKRGNITECEIAIWSINQYQTNRQALEAPLNDDLSDEQVAKIYKMVANDMDSNKKFVKI
jgi:hypothetical protein